MHVVLANRWYPPHSHGGVAMYNYYLAHALVKLGNRVTILTSRSSLNIPEIDNDNGILVHRLLDTHRHRLHQLPFLGRYMRALKQVIYSIRVARRLQSLARSHPFDVVEFADVNAEGWAYLRRRKRRPAVVRCHTPTFVLREYYQPEEMPYNTSWTTRLEKAAIRAADALTAPSQGMAHTISERCQIPSTRVTVIPNGLDVDRFAPHSISADLFACQQDRVIILHVGRLDRIKGVQELARAIPDIVAEAPAAHIVFVGGGAAWQQKLERLVSESGMQAHVTFTGDVDLETLLDWYRRADIAVVPTQNYESFSYTCAQAMAAGVPLVASRIGGIPETVGAGTSAILVEPGNVDELASAIVDLIKSPDKREHLGLCGRQRAQRYFAADVVARQTLEIYRSVLT